MRGSVRIDPFCDGPDLQDVDPSTRTLDVETPPASIDPTNNQAKPSTSRLSQQESTLVPSDLPLPAAPSSRPPRVHRCQSLDLQTRSDLSRKDTSSRRASVNSVGILHSQLDAKSKISATADCETTTATATTESASERGETVMENTKRTKRMWNTINQVSHELNREGRRVLTSLRKRLRGKHGKNETSVKEIHLNPENGEDRWACRSASATSTSTSGESNKPKLSMRYYGPNGGLHVVHDNENDNENDDEYNPELS